MGRLQSRVALGAAFSVWKHSLAVAYLCCTLSLPSFRSVAHIWSRTLCAIRLVSQSGGAEEGPTGMVVEHELSVPLRVSAAVAATLTTTG